MENNIDYSYLDTQLNSNRNLPQYGGKRKKDEPVIIIQQVDSQGIKKLTRNDPSYKKPKDGTVQEQISKDPKQIKKKLENQIEVPNNKLCNIPIGTWVRYINKKTGQYRAGGVLRQIGSVDGKTAYLYLANPYTKISWSAQVKDNIFYIADKEAKDKLERDKERVYKAYKAGILVKRKSGISSQEKASHKSSSTQNKSDLSERERVKKI